MVAEARAGAPSKARVEAKAVELLGAGARRSQRWGLRPPCLPYPSHHVDLRPVFSAPPHHPRPPSLRPIADTHPLCPSGVHVLHLLSLGLPLGRLGVVEVLPHDAVVLHQLLQSRRVAPRRLVLNTDTPWMPRPLGLRDTGLGQCPALESALGHAPPPPRPPPHGAQSRRGGGSHCTAGGGPWCRSARGFDPCARDQPPPLTAPKGGLKGTQRRGWVPLTPIPCDIPSRCCFFTGPRTVTRSSLRVLRRVAVGRCGRCSCWCCLCVRGAPWLVCSGCAGCGGGRLTVFAAHTPPLCTHSPTCSQLRNTGAWPYL